MITVYLREVTMASSQSVFYAGTFHWEQSLLVLEMEDRSELFIPESNIAYYTVKN